MGFYNSLETIITKSRGEIFNFYSSNNSLYYREFRYKKNSKPVELLENVSKNKFDIKIDNKDRIYGIIDKEGEVFFIYENGSLQLEKLFEYNNGEFYMIYPYIKRIGEGLLIVYYLQSLNHKGLFSMRSHYFDGREWFKEEIDIVKAAPIINPFSPTHGDKEINIFYFNKNKTTGIEEIYLSTFNVNDKNWSKRSLITETNNKKIYLDVIKDKENHYLTWSEFFEDNLIVKYKSFSNEGKNNFERILSTPSNCSFPTIIKRDSTLCCFWVQMNKLYKSFSLDQGNNWSSPELDNVSIGSNFIRYRFYTNYELYNKKYILNYIFGTYYPTIMFLGFE